MTFVLRLLLKAQSTGRTATDANSAADAPVAVKAGDRLLLPKADGLHVASRQACFAPDTQGGINFGIVIGPRQLGRVRMTLHYHERATELSTVAYAFGRMQVRDLVNKAVFLALFQDPQSLFLSYPSADFPIFIKTCEGPEVKANSARLIDNLPQVFRQVATCTWSNQYPILFFDNFFDVIVSGDLPSVFNIPVQDNRLGGWNGAQRKLSHLVTTQKILDA
jgi:hypothetical protein